MFVLGSASSCLTSLLASCAAFCACEACKCVAGSITRASARFVYALFFLISVTVAWIMRDYAQPLMEKIPWIVHAMAKTQLKPSDEWLGKQAVYRITCGSAMFFGAMAVMTAGVEFRNDPRDKHVQHGGWGLKLLLYILLTVLPFFFPSPLIAGYIWIARICGGLFLILQMIILLDFTQTWNDSWVNKESSSWLAALLGLTLCFFTLSIFIMAELFIYFVPQSSCSLNTFFIVMAALLCLSFTIASLHPAVPSGSIFPSAVVTLYSFYVVYSALISEPASYECNKTGAAFNSANGKTLAIGMGVTLISVVYSALRAGSSDIWGGSGGEDGSEGFYSRVIDEEEPLVAPGDVNMDSSMTNDAIVDYEPVSYNYSFFHVTFALACTYVAMLMTGWSESNDMEKNTIDVGWASVWVKICSQWLAGLLYMWTLIAPLVLPDRDFS